VSATVISLEVVRELRAICGEDHVSEETAGSHRFMTDSGRPVVVARPGSAEEAAATLQFANAHRLTVIPEGGLTAQCITAQAGIVLQTSRLTQVEHYDHADLTVGVGAGTTVAQLNAMVGADRLLFACDPPLPEHATVGGILATASHGPLRHGYGALRDFCIGIRFVTGDGRRAKGGGRVVKNVAGYDLMKLLIGSYGTLAVITSASFKLFPAPRQTRTFLAEFGTAKEALQFRDLVMRSPLSPICLEVVSPGARRWMRPEVTSDAWVICVQAAGSDAVLARYRKELGAAVTRELEGDSEKKMWRVIEDFPVLPDGSDHNAQESGQPLVVELTVWPREIAAVVDTLLDTPAAGGPEVGIVGRVGVGHLLVRVGNGEPGGPDRTRAMMSALRTKLGDSVGVKVLGACNPWPIAPSHLDSMRAVKQALDPNNVLRGREIF
jgi:glycolate oxidase FAD binding subunit